MKKERLKAGTKVRFINHIAHDADPWCYPEVGTIGEIICYSECANCTCISENSCGKTKTCELYKQEYYVQWPIGSTSYEDAWYAEQEFFEVVK